MSSRCETVPKGQRTIPSRRQACITPTDLLTVSQVARLLQVSRRTVERMVGRGQLPFFNLPVRGGLRFSRQEIHDWLKQRHQQLLE